MSSARRAHSLWWRVFRVMALFLAAVAAIFTSFFVQRERQRLEADLAVRGQGIAGFLAAGTRVAAYAENAELAREPLGAAIERRDVLAAAIFTEDRALVSAAGRTPALGEAVARLTPADLDVARGLGPVGECGTHAGGDATSVLCPILIRQAPAVGLDHYFGGFAGTAAAGGELVGFVKLTLDRGPMRRELGAMVARSLLLALAILLAGTAIGYVFTRRVTGPLERLTDAVRSFGAGGAIGELGPMPDDEIGRLAGAFTAMTRDLAEREREKQALAGRLAEARRMEAVGALSQAISHDFKNILTTLNGAVHVLRKGAPESDHVRTYTDRMQVTLDRARDLVGRLVAFSRSRQIHPVPVDLAALLARLEPVLREALGERVRLEVAAPAAPVVVHGDAGGLEQVLSNLAYNARDAMPGGGLLEISLEALPAASPGAPGRARITVRDTGAGMGPEVRARLYEPFFTTKGSGTGLGLPIVRDIVEQHRGEIAVESSPGAGTRFTIDLPLAAAQAGGGQG